MCEGARRGGEADEAREYGSMKSGMRSVVVRALLVLLLLSPIVAGLHYVLPSHEVVRITATDIRRIDERPDAQGRIRTRDVYYIFAERPETGAPRVFRNEDTGWGFPPYFKFNSADVQARAASAASERATALVTYYGWRIQMFSVFPNAVSIRRVPADYTPVPWFNIVFLAGLAILVAWAWIAIARWRRRRAA